MLLTLTGQLTKKISRASWTRKNGLLIRRGTRTAWANGLWNSAWCAIRMRMRLRCVLQLLRYKLCLVQRTERGVCQTEKGRHLMLEKWLSQFGLWWRKRLGGAWGQVIYNNKTHLPYLVRYYLAGERNSWGLFLHNFVNSDPADEGLHDHPWSWSISLPLVRGYREVRWDYSKSCEQLHRVLPFIPRLIRGATFHRVVLPKGLPAWTLFFHSKRNKSWGFKNMATGEYRKFVYKGDDVRNQYN